MSKPVIVLVPGAWHRPQHLHKVISGLEKAGYEAHGVALVSVDSNPPVNSWDKDAEAVREVIVKNLDADKDVIVIAHSYGGIVMSEAAKALGKKARREQGLQTGVLRLIYMCAIAPRKGETLQDKTKPGTEHEANLAQQQMQAMKIEENGMMLPADRELGRKLLYNRCSAEDIEMALDLVGAFPVAPLLVPATYTAYLEIPSTYIVCENDMALAPSAQERMVAEGEGAFDVVRCQEGHSPYLSNPSLIVDVIRRAAGEDVKLEV